MNFFKIIGAIDDKNSLHHPQACDCRLLLIEGVGRGNCVGGAQGTFVIDGTLYSKISQYTVTLQARFVNRLEGDQTRAVRQNI